MQQYQMPVPPLPAPWPANACDALNMTWVTAAQDRLAASTRHAYVVSYVVVWVVLLVLWAVVSVVLMTRAPAKDTSAVPAGPTVRARWRATWGLWARWMSAPVVLAVLGWLVLQLSQDLAAYLGLHALQRAVQDTQPSAVSLPAPLAHDLAGLFDTQFRAVLDATELQLITTEVHLNEVLFGWVAHAVPQAHAVLQSVQELMAQTIHDVLGGTPLQRPVAQFAQCLVGHKLAAADAALAWVQTHARLTLPSLPTDMATWLDWPSPQAGMAAALQDGPWARQLQAWLAHEQQALQRTRAVHLALLAALPVGLWLAALVRTIRVRAGAPLKGAETPPPW